MNNLNSKNYTAWPNLPILPLTIERHYFTVEFYQYEITKFIKQLIKTTEQMHAFELETLGYQFDEILRLQNVEGINSLGDIPGIKIYKQIYLLKEYSEEDEVLIWEGEIFNSEFYYDSAVVEFNCDNMLINYIDRKTYCNDSAGDEVLGFRVKYEAKVSN
jgi:hypothetical protein